MKTLVIVESPAKAKTIEKYLGKDYKVLSSVGHIRDLATTGPGGLGIDIENDFEPTYKFITGKKKVVNELKKEQERVDRVLIATDPDREGEAIGWHLAEVLDLDENADNRVVFNEITKSGVAQGIKHIRKLDMDLVHSQEGRRMIDRIIGFRLSSLLKKKIKVQSAGRVQSVALRMIVEREEEILAFIPKEYWTLIGKYKTLDLEYIKNKDQLPKEEIDKLFDLVQADKELKLADIKTRKKKEKPNRIFTTSTMQQTAVNRLNFSSRRTMSVAQKLYEGIDIGDGPEGLITYMRTDSTRISSDFGKTVYGYINKVYGKDYVGFYAQKKSANSQDAHEGIRPTNINNTPGKIKEYLTADEYKLYSLVWKRTMQALMKESETEIKTYMFVHKEGIEFKTSNSTTLFDGFKILDDKEDKVFGYKFEIGDKIKVDEFEKIQHFTQPKPRYTEAKLIKELEENGVGRPSTYASIIDILKKRNYVVVDKKAFRPTEDGFLVTNKLKEYFSQFINVKYTSELEKQLDSVAEGKEEELVLMKQFYDFFSPLLDTANKEMVTLAAEGTGRYCPECGEELVVRKSKYGEFVGCSGFPNCKYNEIEKVVVGVCPQDGGDVIEKKTRRGKVFYGCENYPKCDYAVWELTDVGKPMVKKTKDTSKSKSSKKKSTKRKTTSKKA